jgi:hypothetical protein
MEKRKVDYCVFQWNSNVLLSHNFRCRARELLLEIVTFPYARGTMFGELKQRSVLWDEPRAAAEGVGVNYFMGVVLSKLLFFRKIVSLLILFETHGCSLLIFL